LGKPDYVKSVVLGLLKENKIFEASQYLQSEERPNTIEEDIAMKDLIKNIRERRGKYE